MLVQPSETHFAKTNINVTKLCKELMFVRTLNFVMTLNKHSELTSEHIMLPTQQDSASTHMQT